MTPFFNLQLLLQTSLFYLVPLIIGRGLCVLLFNRRLPRFWQRFGDRTHGNHKKETWYDPIFYFSWGILLLFGLALITQYVLVRLTGFSFELLYFQLVWIILGISLLVSIIYLPVIRRKTLGQLLVPIVSIVGLSLFASTVWLIRSPTPLNWDWYQHQQLSRLIQAGDMSFFTSQISDTFGFDSYPPTFHTILAIAQFPAQLTPQYVINFWNMLSIWHLMFVGMGSWIFGQVVSRKTLVGFLSATIGILVFDSTVSFTNLFLLPQTLAAGLFALAFGALLWHLDKDTHLKVWQSVSLALVLVLLHYVVGTLAGIIFLSFDIYGRIKNRGVRFKLNILPIVPFVLVAAITGVLASEYVDFSQLNRGEAESYIYTYQEKLDFTQTAYGFLAFIFVPLGIAYMIPKRRDVWRFNLLILFGFGTILFSNFPYVLKFYTLARFWIHLCMAVGMWSILRTISWKPLRLVTSLMIVPTLLCILILNSYQWKAGLLFQDRFTHVAQEDIELAEFLQARLHGQAVLLISDPSTQFILEGLSGIDTPGGAYMSEANRRSLYLGLLPRPTWEKKVMFDSIVDVLPPGKRTRYLVLSGRTFAWFEAEEKDRLAFDFNTWTPTLLALDDWRMIQGIDELPFTNRIYASPYAVVYELE